MWPRNPTHGYIYPKETKTLIGKDTCAPMFIAALCIVVKTRKQPKCTQRDEWIKMHDRYIQENNSHKKECSNLEGFGWYYAK